MKRLIFYHRCVGVGGGGGGGGGGGILWCSGTNLQLCH